MTITVANTSNTNTFDYWKNRTNELAHAMSTKVVTTDSNTTVGNAAIGGRLTASSLSVSNTSANLVINIPTTSEISSGAYYLNANGSWAQILTPIDSGSDTTAGTIQQEIDNYDVTAYKAVEYLVNIRNNSANAYQTTKLLTTHNVGVAYVTEYATITTNTNLGTFAATSNGTHVRLLFTPSVSSTTISFSRINV